MEWRGYPNEASTLPDQIFGMLLARNAKGIVLKTRFGIHTFFMKKPIDILILSKQNKIMKMKKNLKPNKVFFWNPLFNKVVELPADSIERLRVNIGDKI